MPPFTPINVGAAPNDDTGDTLRDALEKVNTNFADAQAQLDAKGSGLVHPLGQPDALNRGRIAFDLPEPIFHRNLLTNSAPAWPDGARYITVIDAQAAGLPAPLDAFYAYVASHDGTSIWLATAPHPLGPWTWRQAVLTVAGLNPHVTDHVSSPSAVVNDGEVWLYFHGMRGGMQPTWLATSADGVGFALANNDPVIPAISTVSRRFYGLSTSYARIIRDGSLWLAFFQANWTTTVTAGVALSEDGLTWRPRRRPLFGNPPGELGPFAPAPLKLWDRWLIISERVVSAPPTQLEGHLSVGSDVFGEYEPVGPIAANDGTFNEMEWPFPLVFDGALYLFFGASPTGGGQFAIHAAEFKLGGPA